MTEDLFDEGLEMFLNTATQEAPVIDQDQLSETGHGLVRLQSTVGVRDVIVDTEHDVDGVPGYTVRELMALANLYVQGSLDVLLGTTSIDIDTVVAPGIPPDLTTITLIGNVKGG